MKFLLIALTSLMILNSSAFGATLKCKSQILFLDGYCFVEDNGIFDGSHVKIDAVERHRTNENVTTLAFSNIENVNYFPSNIDKHFQKLNRIYINFGQLKKINQTDLENFPKLVSLDLSYNNIRVIEKDTFKYNLELEVISLRYNQIFYIHNDVFSGLSKLRVLNLADNECQGIFSLAYGESNVANVVKNIEASACSNMEGLIKIVDENAEIIKNLQDSNLSMNKSQILLQNEIQMMNATIMEMAEIDEEMSARFDIFILFTCLLMGLLISLAVLYCMLKALSKMINDNEVSTFVNPVNAGSSLTIVTHI